MDGSAFANLPLRERLSYVLRGCEPAVNLFLAWRSVLHLWDDLVDRDRRPSDEEIHSAMFAALVEIPLNPFFQKHQDSLMPVLVNAVSNWKAANEFERTDDKRLLSIAYVIRSDYANLLSLMAYLVGGPEWAAKSATLLRAAWTEEDFDAYLNNLAAERAARGG